MGDREDSGEPARILVAVDDTGNQRILTEWLRSRDEYESVERTTDESTAEFDCCILDGEQLFENGQTFLDHKRSQEVILPHLLVVPESRHREIRTQLQSERPELWELVDGLVDVPIAKNRLAERLRTFLRLRRESISAHRQRVQLQTIRDQHTDHGVIVTNTDGVIEYVNEAIERQSGYSSKELTGNTPAMLESGEQGEEFYQDLWETILSGDVWEGAIVNERRDGEHYVVNQTIAPVDGRTGDIEQFVAINHEITDLKRMEERLRGQREQLAVLNRVLRHDIRNDMEVILTWAELLESEVSAESQDHLDKIERAGQHIVELTGVSRDLSTFIHEDESAELEPVSLDRVLSEELTKRRETLDQAEIRLTEAPESTVTVEANELLSSVFRNLINNAVQHNDAGVPEVEVSTETHEDVVQVRVADNGPGVPEDLKESVFGEGEKGLESQGTGIGLFLVDSLVESYGGNVWIEDRHPDQDGESGAVFVVELSRAQAGTNLEAELS